MKVLLIKDVKSLGKIGDIKEVKDGYGKNFLINKGFAKHATNDVIAKYLSKEKKRQQDELKEIEILKNLAKELDKLNIIVTKKLGKNNHLFGAVTKDEIADSLKSQHNIEIDKKHIASKEHIKTVGEHNIDFKLGHGLQAILHVEVIGK